MATIDTNDSLSTGLVRGWTGESLIDLTGSHELVETIQSGESPDPIIYGTDNGAAFFTTDVNSRLRNTSGGHGISGGVSRTLFMISRANTTSGNQELFSMGSGSNRWSLMWNGSSPSLSLDTVQGSVAGLGSMADSSFHAISLKNNGANHADHLIRYDGGAASAFTGAGVANTSGDDIFLSAVTTWAGSDVSYKYVYLWNRELTLAEEDRLFADPETFLLPDAPVFATSVTVTGITGGADLTGLYYFIYDSADISTASMGDQGTGASTDANGNLVIDVTGMEISLGAVAVDIRDSANGQVGINRGAPLIGVAS